MSETEVYPLMSSVEEQKEIRTGRIDSESKYYELFQKSIELGTWNVEKLVRKVGFEDDIEVWDSLDEAEKEQWARIIAYFIDGEHAVAADSRRIIQSMSSPYYDNNIEKEMYATTLAMTEMKHTQFFDIYISNVMDDVFPQFELDVRRGGMNIPRTEACGASTLYERQGALEAMAADGGDPVDLARAATTYHLNVEGTLARGGYFAKNKMMKQAPLKLLNKGFQFISTDEGRHITFGLELLKELIDKEEAGKPEYQGVKDAVWEQMLTDIDDMINTAYFVTDDINDPLDVDLNDLIMRTSNLLYSMYIESLDLEFGDSSRFMQEAQESLEKAMGSDYDAVIEKHSHIYSQKETA